MSHVSSSLSYYYFLSWWLLKPMIVNPKVKRIISVSIYTRESSNHYNICKMNCKSGFTKKLLPWDLLMQAGKNSKLCWCWLQNAVLTMGLFHNFHIHIILHLDITLWGKHYNDIWKNLHQYEEPEISTLKSQLHCMESTLDIHCTSTEEIRCKLLLS